jgi:hypothetical protein
VGATAARASGDLVGALGRAEAALDLAEADGLVVEQVRSHLEVAAVTGTVDPVDGVERARRHLARAEELSRICGLTLPEMG